MIKVILLLITFMAIGFFINLYNTSWGISYIYLPIILMAFLVTRYYWPSLWQNLRSSPVWIQAMHAAGLLVMASYFATFWTLGGPWRAFILTGPGRGLGWSIPLFTLIWHFGYLSGWVKNGVGK